MQKISKFLLSNTNIFYYSRFLRITTQKGSFPNKVNKLTLNIYPNPVCLAIPSFLYYNSAFKSDSF